MVAKGNVGRPLALLLPESGKKGAGVGGGGWRVGGKAAPAQN